MYKGFTLFLAFLSFLSAHAQTDGYHPCEVKRKEDADQFERWLGSVRTKSSARTADEVYKVPVVVHILHLGEPIGEGYNFSVERIKSQVRTLNEDFRRKENTPGFNSNPDGGDVRIEFELAQIDPQGNPTDGIVRVNIKSKPISSSKGDIIDTCSEFSYWNPEEYLNVWCLATGLPPGLFLGQARFPLSDLPGLPNDVYDADGVFINATNFGDGETNNDPDYNLGRTLTHEIGHFLGLLHTFGPCGGYSDYCEDTPPINSATSGCPSLKPAACDGRPAMIENYMDLSYDRCMNIFTNDQIARMHAVIENSPRRKSLLTSPALGVTTGVVDMNTHSIKVYPNPATDKLYISVDDVSKEEAIQVTAHTLLGKIVLKEIFIPIENVIEISLSDIHEKIIILTIEGPHFSHKELIVLK